MNWSSLPLALFALLNVFLMVIAPQQAQGTAGACALFGLAAVLIGAGLWRQLPAVVMAGLALSLVAPVWMGMLMSGNVNPLHIAVRLLLVALFFWLWMKSRPA